MADKKKRDEKTPEDAKLRSRAERLIHDISQKEPIGAQGDVGKVLHELQVHQIELEMQNEELRRAETELVTSHRKYADLYDFAPVGYFVLDAAGVVVEANLTGAAMLGIERKWLVGKPLNVFVAKESQNEFHLHRRRVLERDGSDVCELTMMRQDGSPMYAAITTQRDEKGSGRQRRCMMTVTDITVSKRAEEALRLSQSELREHADAMDTRANERTAELTQSVESLRAEVDRRKAAEAVLEKQAEQLRALASDLTLAEQRERRRLAHVLHDHLQQLLAAAKFRIAALRREESETARKAAVDVDDLINQSMEVSRTLTGELSPPILHEKGLVAAMEWLQRWMKEKHGLAIELSVGGNLEGVGEDVLAVMFHSIRELLFNVVKHAGVKSARISLHREGDCIRAVISDEGVGFDAEPLLGPNRLADGFGLFSIKERFAAMGGNLSVDSAPGKGSRITLVSPPVGAATGAAASRTHRAASHFQAGHEAASAAKGEAARIRLVLVDDHLVMRQGLSKLLKDEADMEVVGEAADGEAAVELVRRLKPDVVLMDISMPVMDGLQATEIIHSEFPEVIVIGLSMFESPERAAEMRRAGAADYVAKSGASEVLVEAIRACWNKNVA